MYSAMGDNTGGGGVHGRARKERMGSIGGRSCGTRKRKAS